MFKRNLLPLLLVFTTIQLHAQAHLPANMFFSKMPNGLDVLVIEDNSVPLATIEITCKNGSFTETPEFNGLSHLYEHMFFKANKDYDSQEEYFSKMTDLGMKFNGSTSFEDVQYFFTLPKYNLKNGLKFMNSAIRFPKFDKKELAHENEVVDEEFQRQESNPGYLLSDAMDHHMWGNLYSRKNTIGNHEIIRHATPDEMDSIKNKYYYPNNILLTVAGDVAHDEVFKLVDKIYGSWKPSTFDPFVKWPIPEFTPLQKKDYFIVESPLAKVPVIRIDWMGPSTKQDPESTYAADIFSFIVDQNSSKLNKALIQTGLATNISMSYLSLNHTGPITLQVMPNPTKIKECLAEIKKQLSEWDADDYFTDAQIETAKRKMEIRQTREQEVTSDYVHVLAFWWASTSLDYFTGYPDNLQRMTRANLQDYVRKYIKDKPYCAALLIDPELEAKVNPKEFFNAN